MNRAKEHIYEKFRRVLPQWYHFIDSSFLPAPMKDQYKDLVQSRAAILY